MRRSSAPGSYDPASEGTRGAGGAARVGASPAAAFGAAGAPDASGARGVSGATEVAATAAGSGRAPPSARVQATRRNRHEERAEAGLMRCVTSGEAKGSQPQPRAVPPGLELQPQEDTERILHVSVERPAAHEARAFVELERR